MSEIAVENINVADILGNADAEARVATVKAALEADPEVSLLVKAAETVEDVYEIVKKFSIATLEQVKVLFRKTVDYYQEAKAVLSDEMLDNVVGGWSLARFWSENKALIIGGAVFVASVAVGAIAGFCTAGPLGAAAGALGGAAAGVALAAIAGKVVNALDK